MNIGQLGMLFQIVGFILVTVFAGILLERGILGIWRGKSEKSLASLAVLLDRLNSHVGISFGPREKERGILIGTTAERRLSSIGSKNFAWMLLMAILSSSPALGTGFIVAGCIMELTHLLWTGITLLLLSVVMLITLIIKSNVAESGSLSIGYKGNIEREEELKLESDRQKEENTSRKDKERTNLLTYLAIPLLILLAILIILIVSAMSIPICLFTGILRVGQFVIKLLAGKDALKKGFLITGSFIAIAGLILEFLATL